MSLIKVDCIDIDTIVKVHPIRFKHHVTDTNAKFKYVGAVNQENRVICRFLGVSTNDYFTGEPEDVQDWINDGTIWEDK